MQYVLESKGVKESEEERGNDEIDECKVVKIFVGRGAFAFDQDGGQVQLVNLDHVQNRYQNGPEEAKQAEH